MGSWTIKDITDYLYMFGVPVFYLITLVMSMIVATGKNQKIRILGVWSALSVLQSLLTKIPMTYMFMVSREWIEYSSYDEFLITYRHMINASSYTGFMLIIIAEILLWLYVKRAYGVGPAPLILTIGLQFITPVVNVILHKAAQSPSGPLEYSTVMMITLVGSIFPLIITCVFFFIFFKNRGKEKDIPSFWMFRLMSLIAMVLSIGLLALSIPFYQNPSYEMWNEVFSIVMSFITIATALYLVIRSKVAVEE